MSGVLLLQGMKVFFLIVVAVYILYLVFLIVRACSELKNMPYTGTSAPYTFKNVTPLKFLTHLTHNMLCLFLL